ncbi:MAG TPA: ATP-binding protein [Rhizomicrobium sp.]|nr:ATP-binding protein [Rhizomicrobium sp.]
MKVAAIVGMVIMAAAAVDSQSEAEQREAARYVIQSETQSVAQSLMPMIYWDEAYRRTDVRWDTKWVNWEFGPYSNSMRVDASLLLDGDGHVRLSYRRGHGAYRAALIANSASIAAVLAAARRTPRASPPSVATGLVRLGNEIYFAAAGRVSPESAARFTKSHEDIYSFFLRRMTAKSYAALLDTFHLSGAEIGEENMPPDGKIGVPLQDANGRQLGHLWWIPARPGVSFLRAVIPLTIVLLALVALLQAAIVWKWQRMQIQIAEATARATAAVEESEAKSVFIGTISHELRTPLNAVLGFSEMLLSNVFGPLGSPHYNEYAGHIHSSGKALLRTVNDIIQVSRLQSKSIVLDCGDFDAVRIAEMAVDRVRSSAEARQITLAFTASEPIAPCFGAAEPLLDVLVRILDNAIKFSLESGRVDVSVKVGDDVSIAIRDHGIGIAEAAVATLGRPFAQQEGHLVRRYGGIGLGLAVSQGMLELMGGSLSIASSAGVGTTVTIELKKGAVSLLRLAA